MMLPSRTALVVIDVQGKLASLVHDSDAVIRNIRTLIQGAQILQVPVVVTEQYPKGLGATVPEVAEVVEGAPIYEKLTFSCCGSHDFITHLNTLHREDILICGIETHVCVYQTARDLIEEGFNVQIVTDAVSSRTEANRTLGIERIRQLGVEATGVEMVLFELLHQAGSEEFKAISKLLK